MIITKYKYKQQQNENFQTQNQNKNIIVEFKQDLPKVTQAVVEEQVQLTTKDVKLTKQFITGNFTIKNLKLYIKKGDILQLIPTNSNKKNIILK